MPEILQANGRDVYWLLKINNYKIGGTAVILIRVNIFFKIYLKNCHFAFYFNLSEIRKHIIVLGHHDIQHIDTQRNDI
jgi:hypothetical protein